MSDGMVMKPVWRLNIGNGVPSDYGFKILYADGGFGGFCGDDYDDDDCYWSIDSNDKYQEPSDIYAYQTNRTKQAKYR